jgi:pSer/pThr/pTyr-binding forkhead associated (FHA) protein
VPPTIIGPMALTVVVRSGESGFGQSLTLDAPRIVIGRSGSCEVQLPDISVSQRHASIRQRGPGYIVMDEGSTNGTFVGNVQLPVGAPRVLVSGDLLRIGRVWLEIQIGPAVPTPNVTTATREMALGLVAQAMTDEGREPHVVVSVTSGPDVGKVIRLAEFGRTYVVGRAEDADLALGDPDCSRQHVAITRRGDALWVKDLDSKNGATLDGMPLPGDGEKKWSGEAVLGVGQNQLVFQDPLATMLRELDSAPDEQMDPNEAVDPAPGEPTPAPAPVRSERAVRQTAARGGSRAWTRVDAFVALLAMVVIGVSFFALRLLLE